MANSPCAVAAALLAVAMAHHAGAAPIDGDVLNIGANTLTLSEGSGAIGQSNLLNQANYALTIGQGNTLDGHRNLAVGFNNEVDDLDNAAIGKHNYVDGLANLVVGNSNSLIDDDDGDFSIVGGQYNLVDNGRANLVTGALNVIDEANNSALLGTGLISDIHESVVVGRYNEYAGIEAHFIVGNGAANDQRSNAFVVLKNGDVIIPKVQGDISMGEFGN